MILQDKHILLGITGGIAAYKTCELVRLYKKAGAEVSVIMTPNAKEFVSPLVLSSLSQNKVYCEQFDYENYDIKHISLADRADVFVIAPTTANTLSKIANGIADNLLTSIACAFNKKILLAPAMNNNMYENPIIQENLAKLKSLNYHIMEPEEGFLACGVNAKGRMPEPEKIFDKTCEILNSNKTNKKILITAGGTKENIDPVRYIGNYSSGKMGIALADEAHKLGYEVSLISTVHANKPYKIINVQTAEEMLTAVKKEFTNTDYLIMAAAVADYRPENTAKEKIKKENNNEMIIKLIKNPDILKEIGKIKNKNQKIIGFCAESENLIKNATEKIKNKNLDYIVANDISRTDIGFGSDFNEVTILDNKNNQKTISKASKNAIAKEILKEIMD